jgi:hypothetical protein
MSPLTPCMNTYLVEKVPPTDTATRSRASHLSDSRVQDTFQQAGEPAKSIGYISVQMTPTGLHQLWKCDPPAKRNICHWDWSLWNLRAVTRTLPAMLVQTTHRKCRTVWMYGARPHTWSIFDQKMRHRDVVSDKINAVPGVAPVSQSTSQSFLRRSQIIDSIWTEEWLEEDYLIRSGGTDARPR